MSELVYLELHSQLVINLLEKLGVLLALCQKKLPHHASYKGFYMKIHYLTREFRVKLHTKTDHDIT